jgi:hypothetical protein
MCHTIFRECSVLGTTEPKGCIQKGPLHPTDKDGIDNVMKPLGNEDHNTQVDIPDNHQLQDKQKDL